MRYAVCDEQFEQLFGKLIVMVPLKVCIFRIQEFVMIILFQFSYTLITCWRFDKAMPRNLIYLCENLLFFQALKGSKHSQ